jgi:uncharacterized protein YqgC (DUF456 family)
MLIDWSLLGELLLRSVVLTFMLVGLFGLVIPIFPGIIVIWLAALVYAVTEAMAGNMSIWGWVLFALITVLMIIGNVVDDIIMTQKLRESGTPWSSIAIGFIAGVISSFFLTPFAALLITPLALYLAEYYRLRNGREAIRSAKGWLIGFGWSFAAMFAIGLAMIGLWVSWAWVLTSPP